MASKLLVAFALGMVAGVLLAPDKGGETRKKIAQKGKDLKNKFNDFVDGLHEKFDSVNEDVEEAAAGTRQTASSFAGDGSSWGG
jgi:gas vesicle protein